VLEHLSKRLEAHRGVLVEAWEEVSLGVTERTTEYVFHFIFLGGKVIRIHSQLSLYLDFPAFEG
jgi:hypothetical protein